MSYKTYEKYKNSNVEWIGDIPIHWQTNRFKIVFSYSKGKNPQTFFDDPGEGLAPYLSMEYLRNDIAPTYVPIKECPLKANNGDLLLLWDGSNAGEFVVSKEGLVSSTMAKLKPNIIIDNDFYKYVCKAFELLLRELTIGMGVPHVSSLELNNILLPAIPLEEQKQIANYLDQKTAKIDATIAKNEELIELLEEKRVALINQVVTKGLNPDMPMKDSGIEWIGEIPEHWNINNLNYAASDENYSFVDGPFGSDLKNEEYVDEGIPIIQLNNIKVGYHDFTNERFITEEKYNQLKKHSIKPGHIVIAKMAEPVARGTIVSDKYERYTIVADCIKLACNDKFSNRYVTYSLNSYMYHEAVQKATGTTRVRINLQEMKKLKLLIPPLKEQNSISDYLDSETSKIDKTISKIQENINLLEEYKTSLIHHVVTGKIDVRGDEI